MKLLSLASLLAFSVFVVYSKKEEQEVDAPVRRPSSIPSPKTTQKRAPVVNSQGKTVEQVMDENPFGGGTGGAGRAKYNAGKNFGDIGSADDSSSMFSHGKDGKDDFLQRIMTNAANAVRNASKATDTDNSSNPNGTGASKAIRQMTEMAESLSKNGGLKEILKNPAIREASEAIAKSFGQNRGGDNKNTSGNSLRELSQQMMKNMDMNKVKEAMKDVNFDDIFKKLPKADSMPPFDDYLKNLMGAPKAKDGDKTEGDRPNLDIKSILDGLLGGLGKQNQNGNIDSSNKKETNWNDFNFDDLFNDYGDL